MSRFDLVVGAVHHGACSSGGQGVQEGVGAWGISGVPEGLRVQGGLDLGHGEAHLKVGATFANALA